LLILAVLAICPFDAGVELGDADGLAGGCIHVNAPDPRSCVPLVEEIASGG